MISNSFLLRVIDMLGRIDTLKDFTLVMRGLGGTDSEGLIKFISDLSNFKKFNIRVIMAECKGLDQSGKEMINLLISSNENSNLYVNYKY